MFSKIKGFSFPSGSGVALEMYNSLKYNKNIELVFVNSEKNSQNNGIFKTKYTDCPLITDENNLIRYLNNIIKQEQVDFILPTMDMCHLILSKHSTSINATVITSPYQSNVICSNKEKTYNYFKNIINCPKLYNGIESVTFYPIYVKPKVGYSSVGCKKIDNINDLTYYYNEHILITEYLPGKEYTIDCVTSDGNLMYIFPRERVLTRSGLSIQTNQVTDKYIYQECLKIAEKINNNLKFTGSWFFQLKQNKKGDLILLEISTRIAGSSAINRLNNVNLPLLAIYSKLNIPFTIKNNVINHQTTKIYNTYINSDILDNYQNIYIDFDDTLIINNEVNPMCIAFIYKYMKNKNIYLITRHHKDINQSLYNCRIEQNIFKKIINIKDTK